MKYIFSIFIFFNIITISYSSSLISHKGYYNLNLERKKTNSLLEGGDGKSTYLFKKTCEGWSLKENLMISYNLTNKKNSKSYSIFESFEDFSSKSFSFNHIDKSDLSGEINYSGFVKKNKKQLNGKLIDIQMKEINFQGTILFPTEHIIKLIESAKKNKLFFNSDVFFGSSKNNLVKKIAAFIGKKKRSSSKIKSNVLSKSVWPIKLAFYNYKQKKSIPETEIVFDIDEFGIIHNYEIDYGDYKMLAILENIKKIELGKC